MKHLLLKLLFVFALCGPVQARDVLPVAQGHQSVAFPLEWSLVPLPAGTRVEFTVEDKNGIPRKRVGTTGFVLGEAHGVLFIEVPDRGAAWLAKQRIESTVKYQKSEDAVPAEVAEREANIGNAINLAPKMRRLTVTLKVESDVASDWRPGDTLTFFEAVEWRNFRDEPRYYDAEAIFQSARQLDNGEFEVSLIADPKDAFGLLKAELQGRLTLNRPKRPEEPKRCFVTQRVGQERQRMEIPCPD